MPSKRQKTRADVIAKYGRHCCYCNAGPLYKRALHMDHVVPRCDGGADDVSNLRPACRVCNSRKGGKSLQEYVRDRLPQVEEELAILIHLSDKLS